MEEDVTIIYRRVGLLEYASSLSMNVELSIASLRQDPRTVKIEGTLLCIFIFLFFLIFRVFFLGILMILTVLMFVIPLIDSPCTSDYAQLGNFQGTLAAYS
jgi:hypothetical protein